jgi:hypothetical protein
MTLTIENGKASFVSTVADKQINANIQAVEVVDLLSLHLITDAGVFLFTVSEVAINGQTFVTAAAAAEYIETLNN